MKFSEAVKLSGLTKEQVEHYQSAALATWQCIGHDCLHALEEQGMNADMSRADVVEIVLDADYMLPRIKDEAILNLHMKTGSRYYEIRKALITKAFPYARYGW